jgi:hypothetical protein
LEKEMGGEEVDQKRRDQIAWGEGASREAMREVAEKCL